jgi:hypothetical protein
MSHSFHFDPNAILGVPQGASLSEIRDAYHQKSLKYHPDKGGDEWAFRMVVRAYEILTHARVVDRASGESSWGGEPRTPPEPSPRSSWADGFTPPDPAPGPSPSGFGSKAPTNIKGWSGTARSRAGEDPARLARIVNAELLILRFEVDCTLDLFARRPEDRNLSCTLHVTWPLEELADRAPSIADAAKIHKRINDALKSRGVRKHALNKRSSLEDNRLDAWYTYPTAVMASEALDAFRADLAEHDLEVEKQVREMAVPRHWS